MSLTQFVGTPVVRDRLTEAFPNQGDRASGAVQAGWQTQHYILVGTAFDYLARFWLRRQADECYTRPWVAETSLDIAEQFYPEKAPALAEVIDTAKDRLDTYLETGTVTRPLIESALDLARVDQLYRNGDLPTHLGNYDDGDIVDCLQLLSILNDSGVLTPTTARLNPTFGLASSLVDGADADAILDGTLVDLKTTKKATFKADYWRQLVGYLILADVHNTLLNTGAYGELGVDSTTEDIPPRLDIEDFGVYFARHGELSTVSADVVYGADEYEEVRSWFVDTAITQRYEFPDDYEQVFTTIF